MKLDQHRAGGAVAGAVQSRAQHRLAVGKQQQGEALRVQPQFGETGTIGNARRAVLPQPDHRTAGLPFAQMRHQQGEAERGGRVYAKRPMEFVEAIRAQPPA